MRMRMHGDPYRKLARAVVIRAALDYVLLRYPGGSQSELLEWLRSEAGDRTSRRRCSSKTDPRSAPGASELEEWQRQQVADIGRFFANGGEELAKAVGCYDVIDKARGDIDHNRIWVALNRYTRWQE